MDREKETQMKGKIKKSALFVGIAAITICTAAAIASAADKEWNGVIPGEYAMSATGTCLFSSLPFNPNFTANSESVSWAGSSMATGIWTFKRDGTGTVQGTQFGLTLPPANPGYSNPGAASADFWFEFTYEVADDGTISVDIEGLYNAKYITGPLKNWTFTIPPPGHFFGNFSADHKTITLASANEDQKITITNPPRTFSFDVYSICNIGRVLIRLSDLSE